jgi:hypothetical protein
MRKIGTFVAFNPNITVKGGKSGSYPAFQLTFNNADGVVETVTKHVNGLKFKPKLKELFLGLKVGDKFFIDMEKKGEYWELTDAGTGDSELATNPVAAAVTPTGYKPAGKVVGSNYETPQERADRQRLIVRQSCLSNAISGLTLTNKKDVSFEDVIKLATKFEDWVFRKDVDDLVSDSIDEEIN